MGKDDRPYYGEILIDTFLYLFCNFIHVPGWSGRFHLWKGSPKGHFLRRAAATGAIVGGASGSRRSNQASAEATAQVEAQSAQQQAAIEQQMTNFKNAFGACMEGKDYIARS